MNSPRSIRIAWFSLLLFGSLPYSTVARGAAAFPEFVDPNPASGNQFGQTVVALSTGNVVITSPGDDTGGQDAGAVYLFNGSTGTLISTLRGSTAGDQIGSGTVTALTNGNYVILSLLWDNSAIVDAGAVTWGSGTTGVSGVINSANSLVGSTANDRVGSGGVTALSNGNYLVRTAFWDNGAVADVGAVTWGSGTAGVKGVVSSATNSLVGATVNDQVGNVVALSNGNYVVGTSLWDNGAVVNAGAVTWGSGTAGVKGVVSTANSLVGSSANDQVGSVIPLTNGNYVVRSSIWNNGAIADAGAVTWASGTGVTSAVLSAANSLVGSTAGDNVGGLVAALSNGNYVVASSFWHNGGVLSAGAVTWGNGATGITGAVSAANSLAGSTANDRVGSGGVTTLSNGNYVVRSSAWDNGAIVDAGAVTWRSGTSGAGAVVSAANSLFGTTAGDQIGSDLVMALSNSNYVVVSSLWNNGVVVDAGAVTWANGTTGITGAVSGVNSLVGSTAGDQVGSGDAVALTNNNYVVSSPNWHNGAVATAGAATWGSGASGITGAVSIANSLVGSTTNDQVGGLVTALSNGNYVVSMLTWDNGAAVNAGAATWGNGTSGVVGAVSAANSLVGTATSDQIGSLVTALTNGNYVVGGGSWHNGGISNAGAATWGNGTIGVRGAVTAANSLVGSTTFDLIGSFVTPLSSGDYVVTSIDWDNGALVNAGAAIWGSGTAGVTGLVSSANDLVGWAANTSLAIAAIDNAANDTFISRFTAEGGGRVRVGPATPFVILSAADVPNDQGGWLYLTFQRSFMDHVIGMTPVASYGVWRHVPGTLASHASPSGPGAAFASRPDPEAVRRLRTLLPSDLDARETDGQLFVTVDGSRPPGIATAFPAGTWALVQTVPATQQSQYVVAVPTISNAAPNDFVVTAHTTTPSIWMICTPISGQSVDNLAPAQPTQFAAAYSGGQTNLSWATNSEPDLGAYDLYRGASASFVPSPANRIASQITTGYADVGPAGSHYKLSAVDVNGNESSFALITPDATTSVDTPEPLAFSLGGVHPNPARPRALNVSFALPNAAPARLELLDVSGRRVLGEEVGSLGAGRHTVNLAMGHAIDAGVYWVRLTQGSARMKKRAVIE